MKKYDLTNVNCAIGGPDALGRNTGKVEGFRKDKYVGIFYFIWFEWANSNYPYDVTKLLHEHPDELWDPFDKTGIAPAGPMYYFNKPLYGYYNSKDKWVIRKHFELFINAGVDYMLIDLSNDVIYEDCLELIFEVADEFCRAGMNPPKIAAYTNLNTGHTCKMLYDFIYKDGRYSHLWFKGPYDKPLLVAHKSELSAYANEYPEDREAMEYMLSNFHIRPAEWPGFEFPRYEDGVPFVDFHSPNQLKQDLMTISVAQHTAYVFSFGLKPDEQKFTQFPNRGRGYSPEHPYNHDYARVEAGENIEKQWDYAIEIDPDVLFVTGWNELATNKRHPESPDQKVAWFVDSFNNEFSRDMEMTEEPCYVLKDGEPVREGYGDNYYMQLCRNIRRFKGLGSSDCSVPESVYYPNSSVVNEARDCAGYKVPAARNQIKGVSREILDGKVRFTVYTSSSLRMPEPGLMWMNVFVNVGGKIFTINGSRDLSGMTASVVCGGIETGRADLEIGEDFVRLTVANDVIGWDGVSPLLFKAADSVENPSNPLDFYVTGSAAPLGRSYYI